MKKFLIFLFAILIATSAAAQVNYPGEFEGGLYSEWLPLPVQCTMTDYVAPWGSVLDREDRDVVLFGTLIPDPDSDGLLLTIEWLGRSDGYTPIEARPGLRDMLFPWHEEMGAYVALVMVDTETLAFQALTVESREPVLTWRVGYLQFDPAGYPFWPIKLFPYQEYRCEEKTVDLWRHRATGRALPQQK